MDMSLRYFGQEYDSVPLKYIRQIPGITGVVSTLYGTMPGEEWDEDAIINMKAQCEREGLKLNGIESVNVHESIKNGKKERDMYIERYINTLEKLGRNGIHMVCYNFMPVFDWTRTDMAKLREDGSTVLSYDQDIIDEIKPENIFSSIKNQQVDFILPGWEPERMTQIKEMFNMYEGVDENAIFQNLVYFLNAIMPICDKYNIDMAIHPDDPAWSVFGLARIVSTEEGLLKLINAVDNPHNGITLCTGSLGSNTQNDIISIIKKLKGRIHFAHVRNIKHIAPKKFEETAHLSSDGSLNIFWIMKALYETGFDGPIRPDHGRMIWGETAIPGYGLYDRALGATYLNGIWESLEMLFPRQN